MFLWIRHHPLYPQHPWSALTPLGNPMVDRAGFIQELHKKADLRGKEHSVQMLWLAPLPAGICLNKSPSPPVSPIFAEILSDRVNSSTPCQFWQLWFPFNL